KCDPGVFNFETTDELKKSATIIGQERLSASLKFGTNVGDDGYNIFALGPGKTNKEEYLLQFLNNISEDKSTPPDICYINNFDDQYQPKALLLSAGTGRKLKEQMDKVLDSLAPTLTTAFETEEYQNRRQSLQEDIQQQRNEMFDQLKEKAAKKGLSLIITPA